MVISELNAKLSAPFPVQSVLMNPNTITLLCARILFRILKSTACYLVNEFAILQVIQRVVLKPWFHSGSTLHNSESSEKISLLFSSVA